MAFLYSGPAISILSIILTARILGFEMGVARTIGAVSFSVIIGLAMAFIFRKEERAKREEQMNFPDIPEKRAMSQTAFHFSRWLLYLSLLTGEDQLLMIHQVPGTIYLHINGISPGDSPLCSVTL